MKEKPRSGVVEQFVHPDLEPLDLRADSGPFFLQETLAGLAVELGRCAIGDEHPNAATHDHQPVVLKALIGLGDRQRVRTMFCRERANRREGIAVPVSAVENRVGDHVAKADIDGAIIGSHGAML